MRVGDKIYCIKTGHMDNNPDERVFAIKGNYYEVISVGYNFMDEYCLWFVDDGGREHSWQYLDDPTFHEYFHICEDFSPRRGITEFNFMNS